MHAPGGRRYYEVCLRCFGADRCMFESNFPMDKRSCSYHTLWNAFKRVADMAKLSPSEKHAVFCGTAARVYDIQGLPGLGSSSSPLAGGSRI
jgi:L-fuconolactonase